MDTSNLTDHENLLLVRQDIASLKDSQAEFHREVRESFNSLKDGTMADITLLKKDKADRKDVEAIQTHVNELQKIINDKVAVKVENLEATRKDFRSKITMVIWALGLTFTLLLWHVTGGVGGFHI